MRRITKAALGSVVGCALVVGGTQVATAGTPDFYSGHLVDLQLNSSGPFDGATATLRIKQTSDDSTRFNLRVADIDQSAAGSEFGAHLHVGMCVEGDGSLAGAHYNAGGGISEETEVWFNLIPNDDGVATSNIWVPFVPDDSLAADILTKTPGVMSIVIHEDHTDETTGTAGPRQACFPLLVPQWNPTPENT